ncbi:unnamed protein product [Rotaria magnacalcarata]|uniref:Uncharacterized protein n=1 Tax=Rotaria magnacalcarata TaxID=392030 RepID=A0A816PDK2_9BILA|nr:unnamed protein product [Rotaria magnacalcarata]CAF1543020.1 unnamed protein product [Rotaria magnacalcarata]CAF2046472.1 unnamed protein product [Rotaria magnacalcarata]CAF3948533.1 unnamed protein product [Rotaria magnacalcarata]CAF3993565.1 unnamed protein product [Rotaria magnacalcarata]
MSSKFLVIVVASIALWAVAKTLVIKDQGLIADFDQSTASLLYTVPSNNNDTSSSSAISTEEGENLPVQVIEEEKNETPITKSDDSELNTAKDEEQLSTSTDVNKMIESRTDSDTDVKVVKATTEREEKEIKQEEEQKACTTEDEEKFKSSSDKPSQEEKVNAEEHNEAKINDDDLDNVD